MPSCLRIPTTSTSSPASLARKARAGRGAPSQPRGPNMNSPGSPRARARVITARVSEMHEGPHNPLELSSVSPGKVAPHQGMLDCGATASAGPEASVQRLIEAVLRQDKSATVTVDPNQRPYFRYGSGRWGDPPIRTLWPPSSLSCVCSSEPPRVLRAMVHHRHAGPDSGWHASRRF